MAPAFDEPAGETPADDSGTTRRSVLSRRALIKTTTAAGLGAATFGALGRPAGASAPRAAGVLRATAPSVPVVPVIPAIASTLGTTGLVGGSTSALRTATDAGMAVLQTYYDKSAGQWNTTGWWNAANVLGTVVEYTQRTGSPLYLGDIPQTFANAPSQNLAFIDGSYDDVAWWALAWVKAYDLTGNVAYLDTAKFLFAFITTGWIDTCGGGIVWQITNWYKETIANELFLSLAAALHLRTPGDGGSGSYLDWAQREWTWFSQSGLINSQNLINDGLNSNCQNNGETTWTYNQGAILGGLASMYQITGDRSYLEQGQAIATAVFDLLSVGGILNEPYTPGDNASNPVTDPNVIQFKGVFARNLFQLYQQDPQAAYADFLLANAQSIMANNTGPDGQFGYLWQGPADAFDSPFLASVQSSALDCLNAALGVESGAVHPTAPGLPPYPPGPNLVANPSGATATAGWYLANGGQDAGLSTTTYWGSPALHWSLSAIGTEDWVYCYPAVTPGRTYTFSVQVAGWGEVVLDCWTGTADILSLPVSLLPWFQTLSWTVTIAANAPTGQSGPAPQLQVATKGNAAVSVYLRRASVVEVARLA